MMQTLEVVVVVVAALVGVHCCRRLARHTGRQIRCANCGAQPVSGTVLFSVVLCTAMSSKTVKRRLTQQMTMAVQRENKMWELKKEEEQQARLILQSHLHAGRRHTKSPCTCSHAMAEPQSCKFGCTRQTAATAEEVQRLTTSPTWLPVIFW